MRDWFKKFKPDILIGLGLGSMFSATIAAFALAPMMKEEIDKKKEELDVDKLPPVEMVKTAAPYVIPSAAFTCLGVGLVIGGNQVRVDRGAAAMAAYAITDATYREYRDKVKEVIGEKKEKSIEEEIAKKEIEKNPLKGKEIILTGNGNYLCYDKLSGRYFRSDIEKLRRVENLLDRRIIDNMFVSLNELYLEIGLDTVDLGDNIGWHVDTGYLQMEFCAQLTDDGQPCLVMSCANPQPRYI